MRNEFVSDAERERFDAILEALLPLLPPRIREVMQEVPVIVEDQPDAETLKSLNIRHPILLYGLYVGVPIDRRSLSHLPRLGDRIFLFRLGLLSLARNARGFVNETTLREEIRKTLLHEIGHYHGMGEKELEDLGY